MRALVPPMTALAREHAKRRDPPVADLEVPVAHRCQLLVGRIGCGGRIGCRGDSYTCPTPVADCPRLLTVQSGGENAPPETGDTSHPCTTVI